MEELYQSHHLLVVEDSDEDFATLIRAIDRASTQEITIHRCIDGDDALDFLNLEGKYSSEVRPSLSLIILDLNLPGTDGREVLASIKHAENLKTIPVVILSTSSNPKDIARCYRSGANSYMVKPMKFDKLRDSIRIMLDYWFKAAVLPL
jgi:DNA-binding response OmpR family regulator